MDLLLGVGVDVVEVTGDHLRDRGETALLETLAIYKENKIHTTVAGSMPKKHANLF